jgi:hypothetical protein
MIKNAVIWHVVQDNNSILAKCQLQYSNEDKKILIQTFKGWSIIGRGSGGGNLIVICSKTFDSLDSLEKFLKKVPFTIKRST